MLNAETRQAGVSQREDESEGSTTQHCSERDRRGEQGVLQDGEI